MKHIAFLLLLAFASSLASTGAQAKHRQHHRHIVAAHSPVHLIRAKHHHGHHGHGIIYSTTYYDWDPVLRSNRHYHPDYNFELNLVAYIRGRGRVFDYFEYQRYNDS